MKGHLALLGSRGIPAAYGGYETLMEELAPRLVARGWKVTVFCRDTPLAPDPETVVRAREARRAGIWRGVDLVTLPSLRTKHLETPSHTALSALWSTGERFSAALVVNGANAVFAPWLRASGIPTAIHVDGIERQRAKWGPLGRAVYRASERLATTVADVLITDAEVIRDYYLEHHRTPSTVLAYGVDPQRLPAGETLASLGLKPREYVLYVSRFEPENNPHRVAEAYRAVGGQMPLVMLGGAPYADHFIRSFTEGADPRVLFPGAIYGDGYRELLSNAFAYVQATEVGGTHPALVEALGYGNCVLANGTPENREVAAGAAIYFEAHRPSTLANALERLRRDPTAAEPWRREAAERAAERYSWERVTDGYEALFEALISGNPAAITAATGAIDSTS